eukprot:6074596-Amphidinium_carterae.1
MDFCYLRKHCVLHPSSKLRLIFDALSMLVLCTQELTWTPLVPAHVYKGLRLLAQIQRVSNLSWTHQSLGSN